MKDRRPRLPRTPRSPEPAGSGREVGGPATAGQARAERMESLAAVAGGVAHDLNNVLSSVLISVDLLTSASSSNEDRQVLAAVEEMARRGVELVRQILWFARGVETETTVFQLKHLITDVQRVLRAGLTRSFEIVTDYPPDLWLLEGDPRDVYRLLIDLVFLARASTPSGGTLTLAARNQGVDETFAALRPAARPGDFVVVEVSTAKGVQVPPASIAAFVADLGGFHEVFRDAEGGGGIRIYLPVAEGSGEAGGGLFPSAVPPVAGAGEVVLLAEADQVVREVLAAALRRYGYQVLEAGDGLQAIALFSRSAGAVVAVVAGERLGDLDRETMTRVLGAIDPRLPMVLLGGEGEPAADAAPGMPAAGARERLAPPFNTAQLLEALHRALGTSAP